MRAAYYDRQGPAAEVLTVGELAELTPGPGEVRVRITASGINPGDVKKRSGWQGTPMPYPRIVPHSDGAGAIDAVGDGVDPRRVDEPVWCYGAQSYRAFGTAVQRAVVPEHLAVALPVGTDVPTLEQAACLGIAGITGYRAVFADGPVTGMNVLVHGAARGVGSIAAQMAVRGGAHVFAVVRDELQRHDLIANGVAHVFAADAPDLITQIRAIAPEGMHRVADVDFGDHIDLDAQIVANGATISAYASSDPRPDIPYWTLAFANTTIRLLGSDDFTLEVKAAAARELTAALTEGALQIPISHRLPLDDIASAHELVERGDAHGRIVLVVD